MKRVFTRSVIKSVLLISLIIFFSNLIYAQGDANLTVEEQARICLIESKQILEKLMQENFSVQRVNDSLKEAENLFDAQVILKEKKRKYDFSLVLPYCKEIKAIEENAFKTKDEFNALKKFYNEFLTEEMNTSSVDIIILGIEAEIESERYEKVSPLINEAYEKIVNIKADHTTLNLFYKTTTRGLKEFFYENWVYLLSFLIVLIILYIIYRRTMRKWWFKRKISLLEIKKGTLKSLIMKTQKDYFEGGEMSEGNYEIKTKKFAELIRDIDRQIPLLKEELIKAGREKFEGSRGLAQEERKEYVGSGKNRVVEVKEKSKKEDTKGEKQKKQLDKFKGKRRGLKKRKR